MTCFSVGRINYRRKGASWRERRGEGGADVTSDARFLSRIGRRLRFSLSLSSPSLFLSVRRASFSWKSVVRAPNGGLKISHRPKIVDSCVRAPSTSSSRCASTVGARREKVRFFFVLLSHFHEEKLESGVIKLSPF